VNAVDNNDLLHNQIAFLVWNALFQNPDAEVLSLQRPYYEVVNKVLKHFEEGFGKKEEIDREIKPVDVIKQMLLKFPLYRAPDPNQLERLKNRLNSENVSVALNVRSNSSSSQQASSSLTRTLGPAKPVRPLAPVDNQNNLQELMGEVSKLDVNSHPNQKLRDWFKNNPDNNDLPFQMIQVLLNTTQPNLVQKNKAAKFNAPTNQSSNRVTMFANPAKNNQKEAVSVEQQVGTVLYCWFEPHLANPDELKNIHNYIDTHFSEEIKNKLLTIIPTVEQNLAVSNKNDDFLRYIIPENSVQGQNFSYPSS
ncbi:MAG: hypothetical protein WBE18_00030, partial [Gammaproteobacteria bacterium]